MITIKSYKDYTDEELFKLWEDISTYIEYNEEYGIYDGSEYDLYCVGIELIERKYMLDTDEHNALDYYLQDDIYDGDFYIEQEKNGKDYFVNGEENGKEYNLKEGLEIIFNTLTDDIKEYPTEILNGLKKVFKRFLNKEI